MGSRVVIVGGDAGGMTAASALVKRLGDEDEVVVIERGEFTSYSACGLPYWVAGEVESCDDLIARSPDKHRENGIDLRLGVTATSLDADAKVLTTTDGELSYDHLLIATGAEPVWPEVEGADAEGIVPITTIPQGQEILRQLDRKPEKVVVAGSGFIGTEMAEACLRLGLDTTVISATEFPLAQFEKLVGERVHEQMASRQIGFHGGRRLTGFRTKDGRVTGVELDDSTVLDADLVILAFGVTPRSELAREAGLPLGPKGAIVVDEYQCADPARGIWAAGDCTAVRDRQSGELLHLPLGDHANKQGMVAASGIEAAIVGDEPEWSFPGVVQTFITRFCDLEISRTGVSTAEAEKLGWDTVSVSIDTTTWAGYYPGAEPMTVWLLADRRTRQVRGVQIVGGSTAGLRIDAAATAITAGMRVDDLIMLDFAYAPPFSSVWSPLHVAARAAYKLL